MLFSKFIEHSSVGNLGNIFHFKRQEHVRESISQQLGSYLIMLRVFHHNIIAHIIFFTLFKSYGTTDSVYKSFITIWW